MEININEFAPKPKNWFKANIEYEGHGRAIFLNPMGTIEGKAKIKFDEFGHDLEI